MTVGVGMVFAAMVVVTVAQVAVPPEWPRLDVDPVVQPEFRPRAWAEFQWNNGRWEPTRRHERTYDAAGRLASITYASLLGADWRPSRRETLRYNDAGQHIETLVEESLGPALRNHSRYSYRYENGRLVEEFFEGWSAAQAWTPFRRTTFTLNASGRREQEIARGAQPQAVGTRIVLSYDQAGRLLEETRQHEKGKTWVDADRVRRRYDATGRLLDVTMLVVRGSASVEALKLTHDIDAAGRRVATVTQGQGPGGTLRDTMRQLYTYDADGNQTETLFQGWSNGTWTDGRKETIAYERAKP